MILLEVSTKVEIVNSNIEIRNKFKFPNVPNYFEFSISSFGFVSNAPEANEWVRWPYRDGWALQFNMQEFVLAEVDL